jgi:hypothetical protein
MRNILVALALIGVLSSQPTLLDSAWTLLTALSGDTSPAGGSGFDPNGQCAPPKPQPVEGPH